MKIATAVITLSCFAGVANAAERSPSIIQACEALKRQSDRNKCLEAAVKALSAPKQEATIAVAETPAKPPEPSKKEVAAKRADQVLAAAKAMQSVIDIGLSYNDYQPYIQKIAVELGQYQALAQFDEEKQAASFIADALQAYNDAREYWYADIEFYSRRDNRTAYFGSLPMQMAGVSNIVRKYDIPIQKSDLFGFNYGATRSTALSTIWRNASSSVEKAQAALSFNEPNEKKDINLPGGETVAGEGVFSLAARLLIPVVGHDARISTAQVRNGKFVCGKVVKDTANGEQTHLYILNSETSTVNVEGSDSWANWVWPTYCE